MKRAIEYIKERINIQPKTAIILGSGLGTLADEIENALIIPYTSIPGFPVSTAPGHKGNLIFGMIEGVPVVAMQGRFHYYEGYTMEQVTFPVRIFSLLGVERVFVTNAAGGVNKSYHVGDIMLIKDHINMLPNPLIGKNKDEFGVRFPDMTHPYDKKMRESAKSAAEKLGVSLREGVYIGVTGPSYETASEVNFFRMAGADAVGMSTVPEVIVARHCGMRVFGMSIITNEATSEDSMTVNDEQDVLVQADKATRIMSSIVKMMIGEE
ncbi:MAG: purine-nucleoside phosphorylase [Bacteroidales bacterium]|nr:purine-nucleoside phosphorylase [Bacteroidales bacterium]